MVTDILVHVASGVAFLPEARRTLQAIYKSNPARFSAAAQTCPQRHARVLHAGRAEMDYACMQALGILSVGTESEIKRLLRAALRPAFDRLSELSPGSIVDLEWLSDCFAFSDADVLCAQLFVSLGICAAFELQPQASGELGEMLQSMLAEYGRGLEARLQFTARQASAAAAKLTSQCGKSAFSGWQEVADAFAPLELDRELAALEHGGIDIGVYTSGIGCGEKDAPYIAGETSRESFLLATLFLLGRAIGRDKSIALDVYRKQNEADMAIDGWKRAQGREQIFQRRIQSLENALRLAEKNAAEAQAEAKSHAGDAQELAALREALWNGSQTNEEPEMKEKTRDLPKHMVIVGGHPSWAKEMEKATGARAWPAGVTCPPQVVAGADEIWIQAAYMSHKAFFSVIENARKLGKTVRYFPSTGVGRCVSAMRRKA